MARIPRPALALASVASVLLLGTHPASAQTSGQITQVSGTYDVYGTASIFGNISGSNVWDGGSTTGDPLYSGQVLGIQPGAVITSGGGGYDGVYVWGTDQLNMTGGSVQDLTAENSSVLNVSGGSVDELIVTDSATATFSSGIFDLVNVSDAASETITYTQIVMTGSTLTIVGYGLTVTQGAGFLDELGRQGYYYTVSGQLEHNSSASTIEVADSAGYAPAVQNISSSSAAPEPMSLALLAVAMSGVPLARRRKARL